MKILNIMLCASFNDGWGYQENLLTKYQKLNGDDVFILTTCLINNKKDDGYTLINPEEFINENGIKVKRIPYKRPVFLSKYFRRYIGTYKSICAYNPDFIFVHGSQFLDSFAVTKYLKRHKNCKCVVDNHADNTNSAKGWFSTLVHKTLWKLCTKNLEKYVEVFYGVTPGRCDFLQKYYDTKSEKIDLLVMGVDDELVEKLPKRNIEHKKENEPLNIISGGKFDKYKYEILNLMDIVNNSNKLKLSIFGSISDEIIDQFKSKLSDRVIYLGWLNQDAIYKEIIKADVACFPGRHSVIWEQCVGIGTPIIIRNLKGFEHININGNCKYFNDFTQLSSLLNDLAENTDKYDELNSLANKAKEKFRYSEIAKKSIEKYNM